MEVTNRIWNKERRVKFYFQFLKAANLEPKNVFTAKAGM